MTDLASSDSSADSNGGSSFVLVYSYNSSKVRYWYRVDPFRSYLNALRLMSRCVLSLRDVGTTLPINLLLAGERHAGFEERLERALGVHILDADLHMRHRIKVPKWASPFHYSSFIKLAVLSLTQFRTVVVLDTDTVIFRNVDHLAALPAPAFVFRFKCFRTKPPPIWEMNSGVMVLRPKEAAHARMQRLMNDPDGRIHVWWGSSGKNISVKGAFVGSDPGDQSVWRSFYRRVHELPLGYNAFKRTRFANESEWLNVSILHDPDVHRAHKIPQKQVGI